MHRRDGCVTATLKHGAPAEMARGCRRRWLFSELASVAGTPGDRSRGDGVGLRAIVRVKRDLPPAVALLASAAVLGPSRPT